MSIVTQALLSIAATIAAAVAMATLAGGLADVLGGVVVLMAIPVFARAIMTFAAEPAEKQRRSDTGTVERGDRDPRGLPAEQQAAR
jgi:F0F1-type ATP synthase assembly protein I